MIVRILLYFSTTLLLVNSINYTEEETNSGLAFVKVADAKVSYETFTIVYHIDLRDYFNCGKKLVNYTEMLDTKCKKIGLSNCKTLVSSIRKQILKLTHNEQKIMTYQQKKPHLVSMFPRMRGSIDAETARAYEGMISKIHSELPRERQFVNETKTVFINKRFESLNGTLFEIETQFKSLDQKIAAFERSNQNIAETQYRCADKKLNARIEYYEIISKMESDFYRISFLMQTPINEHHQIFLRIVQSLESAITTKNTLNQLISNQQLAQDLSSLQQFLLSSNQMLPIDFPVENPLIIFEYSKYANSLFGNKLLLEISLPIVERESYVAYQIIPIPTFIEKKTIIIVPSMDFVLINTNETKYIPILKSELDEAITNFHNEQIILPSEYSRSDISQKCEINIFLAPHKNVILELCDIRIIPNANYFISIKPNKLYLVAINKGIQLRQQCNEERKTLTYYNLTSCGKLILKDGCQIFMDDIHIPTKKYLKFDFENKISFANRRQKLIVETLAQKMANIESTFITESNGNILIRDYFIDFHLLVAKHNEIIEKFQENYYFIIKPNQLIYGLIGSSVSFVIILIILLLRSALNTMQNL